MPPKKIYEEESAKLKELFREHSKLSQREFARRYNMGTAENLGHYLNGNTPLNIRAASTIAAGLGISVAEFSPRLAAQIASIKNENVTPVPAGMKKIPLMSIVHAGSFVSPGQMFPKKELEESGDFLYVDDSFPDGCYALRIEGASMEPTFLDGDVIVVDPTIGPCPGDYVVASRRSENGDGTEFVFKKYRPLGINEAGRSVYSLISLNPDFPTLRSDREELNIVAVMVEHRRRYRRR